MDSDEVYALRNRRRREILEILCDREEATVACLANAITGESESPSQLLPELCDVHLPLLAERALVEYDEASGTVALAECPETVEAALRNA